jgi:hypothetical protein
MEEYVCVYAYGMLVRDMAKTLLERKLVFRVNVMEVFPMFLKNGKVRLGGNDDAVMMFTERSRLDEVMLAFGQGKISAVALPVIASMGISD